MKKMIFAIIVIITIYSIYYDLSHGTLPMRIEASNEEMYNEKEEKIIPHEVIKVEPGYTVLSIVEELHGKPIPVTIQQIISDFETLNSGVEASNIQIGKEYSFPIYYEN